jgi:hypothetical protein
MVFGLDISRLPLDVTIDKSRSIKFEIVYLVVSRKTAKVCISNLTALSSGGRGRESNQLPKD